VAKVFNAGDPLPASDLNTNMVQPATAGTGTRIVRGSTGYTITVGNPGVTITVTYGFTFSSAPTLLIQVGSHSAGDIIATIQGAIGVSSSSVRVATSAGNNISGSNFTDTVYWAAIGSP
jgi:hypothetical protein